MDTDLDYDTDNAEEMNEPPTKTRKLAGVAKYPSKFTPDWTKQWPCIQPTSQKYKFRCTICQCLLSCQHQAEKDVRRHLESVKHRDNAKPAEKQQSLSTFFKPKGHPIHEKVTRAEVKVTTVLAHHNIPIAVADHISPLFRDIFPDSEIAKASSCARTKTTCILNGAMASHFSLSLIEVVKMEAYSLAIDGSNDTGLQKINPLTVRIYDANRGKVVTQLLDMCLTLSSTAESISAKVSETLQRFGVDWIKCVAFSVDNTSVNVGRRNSIKTRVLQVNPSTYFLGCPCHMVHNTALKAIEKFQSATKFDTEDMLIDLFIGSTRVLKEKMSYLNFAPFVTCNIKTM